MTAQRIAEQLDYYGSLFRRQHRPGLRLYQASARSQILRTDAGRGRAGAPASDISGGGAAHLPPSASRRLAIELRKWTSEPAKRSPGRCSVPNTLRHFGRTKRLRPPDAGRRPDSTPAVTRPPTASWCAADASASRNGKPWPPSRNGCRGRRSKPDAVSGARNPARSLPRTPRRRTVFDPHRTHALSAPASRFLGMQVVASAWAATSDRA